MVYGVKCPFIAQWVTYNYKLLLSMKEFDTIRPISNCYISVIISVAWHSRGGYRISERGGGGVQVTVKY